MRRFSGTARKLTTVIIALAVLIPARQSAHSSTDFLDLVSPPRLGLTLFAGGYGNEQYGSMHEGFELQQSVTRLFSLVARISVCQVYKGVGGYDSPLTPDSGAAVHNFGRFLAGVDFTPFEGSSFVMLGGADVGDANAPVIEGDISQWLWTHTLYPINVSLVGTHYYNNGVTAGLYDVRAIVGSTANLLLLLGVGGAAWGGGTLPAAKAHGGLDVGIFLRSWRLNIDVQTGYGSSQTYGIVNFSRRFGWDE